MEALSRQEYPAMLERLQPAGAVTKFNERVKRIGKVHSEVADWMAERRKVEELYVSGLKKLARRPLQEVGGELGIFEAPWRKIIASTEEIAKSHALLSDRIDKDVEQPLRNFSSTKEMSQMPTIQGNLSTMAKELDDAQDKSEKLSKKGGKASAQKVDFATSRLQTATQQWESQAPFIMENLQALDERRLNHLRDVLTQYETHEADMIQRVGKIIEEALAVIIETDSSQEITNWAAASVSGLPITERRARHLSTVGTENTGNASLPPPPQTPRSTNTSQADAQSEHSQSQSARQDTMESEKGSKEKESKLKSRFGTMLGRRRQSIHGTFRAPSPSKGGFVPFGRGTQSRDGRPSPSPRTSSNNLRESPSRDNRLSSLAESPTAASPTKQINGTHDRTAASALTAESSFATSMSGRPSTNGPSAADLFDVSDVAPPPGPPPSHMKAIAESQKDSEGFNVPAPMNDPISQAESDAALESDQPQFKLDIRKEPIPEQDADAQAALSNVANTLRSAAIPAPNRKSGTVRGRRDVRNTMYLPASSEQMPDIPPSPGVPAGRAAALAALSSSEHTAAPSVSDTTSIRSGHSLTNHAVMKHADMQEPGLNASIIETVNASFENGETTSMKISGEIALNYNSADDLPSSSHETLRIDNFPNLEAIGENRTFINPVPEKPDEFAINLESLNSKATPAFTYRVHIDESDITAHGPLLIKLAWKKQGTDKLGLVLEYSLNPSCGLGPITFTNLVLVAIYEGSRALSCQTKPTGTHLKEKSLVYWRLGDMSLTNEWHKIICRFSGAEGAVPEAGHIEARWEISGLVSGSEIGSGISLSRYEASKGKEKASTEDEGDDPFADETMSHASVVPAGTWKPVTTHKKFVSGKYEAKQVTIGFDS